MGAVADVASGGKQPFQVRTVTLANLTAAEFAGVMSKRLGREIKVRALPLPVFAFLTFIPRLFVPGLRNLLGMMQFIATGRFVA